MIQQRISNAWKRLVGASNNTSPETLVPLLENPVPVPKSPYPEAYYSGTGNYRQYPITFNGEKNLGEIGPIKNYRPDYIALRLRSWQAYIESDIAQTVIKKFTKWIVASGLKPQAAPASYALQSENIRFDLSGFRDIVESRFAVFAKSKALDYSKKRNLHRLAGRAFLESIVGGDVLVILRYTKRDGITVQLVDGVHVQSPTYGDELFAQQLPNGNEIRNGIELSPSGEHIAYYVRTGPIMNGQVMTSEFTCDRIPAKDDTGMARAYMVCGLEYRLDGNRGLPLISVLLETLKKLERYKEATLGSAEERQKIAFFIEHALGSTGENPLTKNMAKAFSVGGKEDIPIDEQANAMADRVAASTNKQVFNMPQQSTIKALTSDNELTFKDFFTVNCDLLCAAINIPPDVAFSKYESNYSASRAALKDWEHTINVERGQFSAAFYQPIYDFWLDVEILTNKVQAPGYLVARGEKNQFVLNAYRTVRWIGAPVPHIDPLKEVKAERGKLGPLGKNMPLTTAEAATDVLNGGSFRHNAAQFAEELKAVRDLGLAE